MECGLTYDGETIPKESFVTLDKAEDAWGIRS